MPRPVNVDFADGEMGQMPPGWTMPSQVLDAGYGTELHADDCGALFSRCVAYFAPPFIGAIRAAELSQTFPAAPYIGKSIRFSAWLRLQQGRGGGYIHIRMRIDYADGRVDMWDSVDPPVTGPEWQEREVLGEVGPGASTISIWARYVPSGNAWVAAPTFGAVVGDKAVTAPPASEPASITSPLGVIVQDMPYSLQRTVEDVETLTDGTKRTTKNSYLMYRDSMGRRRMEDGRRIIIIRDWVGEYEYNLYPASHIAYRARLPRSLATTTARFDLARLPRPTTPDAPPKGRIESLGTRAIDGFAAEGARVTIFAQPDAFDEFWANPKLEFVIREDKRRPGRATVERILNASHDEPDPALFRVPAGYKIVDVR
jgi:hypothetical protein